MSIRRRLDAFEAAIARRQRRVVAVMAAELGLTYDELMEEAEAFLSQPLEAQLAEVDRLDAESRAQGIPWDEAEEIKATLTSKYQRHQEA
jgi:hypothetical protein